MVHRIQLIVTFGIVQVEHGTGQMVAGNISDRQVSISLYDKINPKKCGHVYVYNIYFSPCCQFNQENYRSPLLLPLL